jgi:hypothetical protein
MKGGIFQLGLLLFAVFSIHAIRIIRTPSIKGQVLPAKNVKNVLLVSGHDSVKTNIVNGIFNASVSPGLWTVIIRTNNTNIIFPSVEAVEGVNNDLGKIRLE